MTSSYRVTAQGDCILRWPSVLAQTWVYRFLDAASGDPAIDAVVAVGSSVRHVESVADIDLVVASRGPLRESVTPPMEVDIRVYRSGEAEHLIATGHDLLGWAMQFGCCVFERDGYWTRLEQVWKGRVPLPPAAEAGRRALRAEAAHRDLLAAGDEDAAQEQLLTMLTHLARSRLLEAGIFPTSRPELPEQLEGAGESLLARRLEAALLSRQVAA